MVSRCFDMAASVLRPRQGYGVFSGEECIVFCIIRSPWEWCECR